MSSSELDAPSFPRFSLFPRPQRVRLRAGRVRLPARVRVEGLPEGPELAGMRWVSQALVARGHAVEGAGRVAAPAAGSAQGASAAPVIRVTAQDAGALPPEAKEAADQGYVLRVDEREGISIVPGGGPGLQYALATLAQLIRNAEGAPGHLELPSLVIEDWPDIRERGVMLDISRDKVPTLTTLKALVDRFASLKLNQLQLYIEHTFAYPGHEVVWRGKSPLYAEEIRELDDYCAARHVELVPNQNSFGHMHRWLVHAPYRALAECPEGFVHPWNWSGEPYGLCATDPASLRFLEALYDALLPHFRSRQFNVGLDETLDLGAGRSRAACEARGTERVYLEFLRQVHALVRARGRTMQFWADIIIKRPDLLSELPKDATALEWGYEADHPFAEHLSLLRDAGMPVYVCPGTSSWNSIAGRTENALLNLALAAREGKRAGARGYLITDWGDHGHLQPLSVSYLGFLAGAGFSWNVDDAQDPQALDWPELLDRHIFFDPAAGLGRIAYELGNAYLHAGSLRPNASVLFWILIKPERQFSPPGVTYESLGRTLEYLERAGEGLERARPAVQWSGEGEQAGWGRSCDLASSEVRTQPLHSSELARSQDRPQLPEIDLAREELRWARDVLRFACELGRARCAGAPSDAGLEGAGERAQAGAGEAPNGQPGERDPFAFPAPLRAALAQRLEPLIARHRALWLARNRPGGLDDSAGRLERILAALKA